MELEIDPSGINLTNTYTNINSVSIDSSNIDISGTYKITLNDTNGISINNLTIQPTTTLGSATNVTIDEVSHLTGVTSNIQTQFDNIIDGAPGVLNTLNELATAINGDAAFATTITTSIDTKVSKTGDEDISGIKTIKGQFNYHPGSTISGDMIPESDDTHSLGSVTNRFKHLFVGNSSIWMGEDHKINATDGKLRFRKRKKSKVPRKVAAAGGDSAQAIAFAQSQGSSATTIEELTLNDWLKYGKTLNIDSRGTNIDIEHIYEDGDSDFEEEGSAGQSSTVSILTSELYPNPADHNITWIRGTGNLTDYEYAFIRNGQLPLSSYTWYEHEAKANQLGGNLVSIHSLEEQEFLVTTGNTQVSGTYSAIIGIVPSTTWKNGDPWIGTSHEQWSDGTPFDYSKYRSGEPNNGSTSAQYIYWNHNYNGHGHWADEGSYSPEASHQRAIYKRPYHTQQTVSTDVTSSGIEISGDNLIAINDASGIVVRNLTITPSGSFDICGGNFTISIDELSKLDGITDNIQSQLNTAIAGNIWGQNGVKAYYNSGNVGIGTDNPANKFEVVGGSMLVKPGDAVNALQFHAGSGNTNHTNSIEWYNSSGTKRVLVGSSGDNTSNQFRFWENGSQNFVFLNDSNNTKVGINRPDPQYSLDVTGDVRFSGNLYQGTSNTPFTSGNNAWTESGTNVYRSSGNLGIGTTNPTSRLTIMSAASGNGNSDEFAFLSQYNNAQSRTGYIQKIGFYGKEEYSNSPRLAASIECLYGDNKWITNNPPWPGKSSSNLIFKTADRVDGDATERMRINYDGNVGIGTTNPVEKLHVNGDIAAKYNGASIYLGPGGDTDNSLRLHYVSNNAYLDYNDTNNGLYMRAYNSGSSPGTALFLKKNAYVGVGHTSPTERLDVNGNIKASGTITSGAGTLATETYVNTQVTNLIGGAPGALDTLNELAAAIGDDANYASSITTSLAGKVSSTGDETISGNKTFSGDIEFNNINFTGTLTQNGTAFTSGGDTAKTIDASVNYVQTQTVTSVSLYGIRPGGLPESSNWWSTSWTTGTGSFTGFEYAYTYDGDHQYAGNVDFTGATHYDRHKNLAIASGAHLIFFTSEEERNMISGFLTNEFSGYWNKSVILGNYRVTQSDPWLNIDGTTMSTESWSIPSNYENNENKNFLKWDPTYNSGAGRYETISSPGGGRFIYKRPINTLNVIGNDIYTNNSDASNIKMQFESIDITKEINIDNINTKIDICGNNSLIISDENGINLNNKILLHPNGNIDFSGSLYKDGVEITGGGGGGGGGTSSTLIGPFKLISTGRTNENSWGHFQFERKIGSTDYGAIGFDAGSSTGTSNVAEAITLKRTGQVGIGTNNPSCTLTVGNYATSDTGGTNSMAILAPGENAQAILYFGTQHNNNGSGGGGGIGKAAIIVKGGPNGGGKSYSRSDMHFCMNEAGNNNDSASLSDSKMTIMNNGNVGIGTTTPAKPLEVYSDGNGIGMRLTFSGNSSYYTDFRTNGININPENHFSFDIQGNEKMRINSNGRVGIGTTSPAEKFTVQDNNSARVAMFKSTRTESTYFGVQNGTSLAYIGIDGTGLCNFEKGALLMGVWNDEPIIFTTGQSNTEKMRINSNGKVGIGTTNPSYKLDVVGTSRFTDKMLLGTTLGNAAGKDWHNAHLYIGGVHNQEYNTSSTYKLVIAGSDNEATGNYPIYVIDENEIPLFYIQQQSSNRPNTYYRGKIGIGDSPFTPSKSLDVQGDINFTGDLYQNGSIFSGGGSSNWTTSGSNVYRSSGNVGIGTTSPASLLHIFTAPSSANTTNRTMLTIESDATNDCNTSNFNPISIDFVMGDNNDPKGIARIGSLMCPTGATSGTLQGEASTALTFSTQDESYTLKERMRIDHSGNVGIGTSFPRYYYLNSSGTGGSFSDEETFLTLHTVNAKDKARLLFSCGNNHTASIFAEHVGWGDTYMAFTTTDGTTAPQERMRITHDGNVGIGTTTTYQNSKLHVNGDSVLQGQCKVAATGNNQAYQLIAGAGTSNSYLSTIRQGTGWGTTPLALQHAGGNVGIGTNNPGAKLDVKGSVYINESNDAREYGLQLARGGITGQLHNSLTLNSRPNSDNEGTLFQINGSTKMFLSRTGFVGIGTTAPSELLHVKASGNTGRIRIESVNDNPVLNLKAGSNNMYLYNQKSNGNFVIRNTASGSNKDVVWTYDGKLGVRTTTPRVPLDVIGGNGGSGRGAARYFGSGNTTLAYDGNIDSDSVSIRAQYGILAGTYVLVNSDKRIKNNFQDISDNEALNIVNNIESIKYDYIDPQRKEKKQTIGFIAQEVRKVLPNAVKITANTIPDEMRIITEPVWIDCSYITIRYEPKTTYTETITYKEGPLLDSSGNQLLDQCGNLIIDPSAVKVVDPSGAQHVDPSGIVIEEWHPKWKLQIPDLDMSSNNTGQCRFYFSNDASGNDETMKDLTLDASSNNTFEALDERYNNVFFYGKEVNDFHTLDKAQIFALHHSAIQELSRKNDRLVSEKETMQTQITTLLEENNSMKSRLEALEAAIINLQNS